MEKPRAGERLARQAARQVQSGKLLGDGRRRLPRWNCVAVPRKPELGPLPHETRWMLTGTSGGNVKSLMSKSGADQSAGDRPTRTARASRAAPSCWCSVGSEVRSTASWLSAVNTSVRAAAPSSNSFSVRARFFRSLAISSSVVAICNRGGSYGSDSLTTLPVSDSHAASSWYPLHLRQGALLLDRAAGTAEDVDCVTGRQAHRVDGG